MFDELLDDRPKVTVRVLEICYFGNDQNKIEDVINALYKAKKTKGFDKVWVDIETHEDEWGHHTGTTLVVNGDRPMTDKEWLTELTRAVNRQKSEAERNAMQYTYFTSERFAETQKQLNDKIKEIKGGK
jgi:bifunctional N-acetylglucosamine-1-phosphate-uridyltransferase/glucosamine-1-phosphate-acetyltransferase GlmU-like protein